VGDLIFFTPKNAAISKSICGSDLIRSQISMSSRQFFDAAQLSTFSTQSTRGGHCVCAIDVRFQAQSRKLRFLNLILFSMHANDRFAMDQHLKAATTVGGI
jgi:hypothetical protein